MRFSLSVVSTIYFLYALSGCGSAVDSFANDKKIVAGMMKDPSTVQFQNLRRKADKYDTVCGDVNAKNSFGAYVGFVPFEIYTDADKRRVVRLRKEPDQSDVFHPDTNTMAINSGISSDCAF